MTTMLHDFHLIRPAWLLLAPLASDCTALLPAFFTLRADTSITPPIVTLLWAAAAPVPRARRVPHKSFWFNIVSTNFMSLGRRPSVRRLAAECAHPVAADLPRSGSGSIRGRAPRVQFIVLGDR